MHDLESKGEDVDVNDETLKKLEHHHLRNVKLQGVSGISKVGGGGGGGCRGRVVWKGGLQGVSGVSKVCVCVRCLWRDAGARCAWGVGGCRGEVCRGGGGCWGG